MRISMYTDSYESCARFKLFLVIGAIPFFFFFECLLHYVREILQHFHSHGLRLTCLVYRRKKVARITSG